LKAKSYLIINLENYGIGWEPDLSKTNTKKILWSIDSHVKGEEPFLKEFYRSGYNILLHSTKDFVNDKFKIWFPNAFDDTLIFPKNIEKKYDVGFCGSLLNRQYYINLLNQNFNFIHHNFVIGDAWGNLLKIGEEVIEHDHKGASGFCGIICSIESSLYFTF
jgi:hypothetical protein